MTAQGLRARMERIERRVGARCPELDAMTGEELRDLIRQELAVGGSASAELVGLISTLAVGKGSCRTGCPVSLADPIQVTMQPLSGS